MVRTRSAARLYFNSIFSEDTSKKRGYRKMMSHKKLSHKLRETNQHYSKDQFGEQYEICNKCKTAVELTPDLEITRCPNCAAKFKHLKPCPAPTVGIVRYVF